MLKKSDYSLILLGFTAIVVAFLTYLILVFVSPSTARHYDYSQVMTQRDRVEGDVSTDIQLEDLVQEALNNSHEAASTDDEKLYQTICNTYKTICDKTNFTVSNLTKRQEIYYQVIVIYVLQKLSTFGVFSDYMSNITIKSKSITARGFSTDTKITLDVKPMKSYNEFLQVMIHEFGHIVDLQQIIGTLTMGKDKQFTEFGESRFSINDPSLDFYKLSRANENTRLNSVNYEDFVSGYGMSDTFEDFAECFNFYLNYNLIFQKLTLQSNVLKQKYDYIDQLLGGNYISDGQAKQANFELYKRDFRPYDTTRF